jgi:hypothetical protein
MTRVTSFHVNLNCLGPFTSFYFILFLCQIWSSLFLFFFALDFFFKKLIFVFWISSFNIRLLRIGLYNFFLCGNSGLMIWVKWLTWIDIIFFNTFYIDFRFRFYHSTLILLKIKFLYFFYLLSLRMASIYDPGREFAMLNLDWLNIFFVIFLFYLLTLSYFEIQLHNFFYGNSFFFSGHYYHLFIFRFNTFIIYVFCQIIKLNHLIRPIWFMTQSQNLFYTSEHASNVSIYFF